MTISKGMFGVFVLRGGAWHLHGVYATRSGAQQELTYLVDVLGAQARMFVKD